MKSKSRIGILSGSFNPIHLGHITFALQATQEAKLDKVYFLPERSPKDKDGYEHFGHRVAMIKRAIKPHPKLELLELDDMTFSVNRTLPKLRKTLNSNNLVFLFGSDKIPDLINWPNIDKLLNSSEVVIGLRQNDSNEQIKSCTKSWPKPPLKVIDSYWPSAASTDIRQCLQNDLTASGLLKSVASYARHNWLYISLR